jgi:HSP20 family protein
MLPSFYKRSYNPFLSNLFDDNLFYGSTSKSSSLPAVNIRENEKSFALELAVPGMNKSDFKIEVNDDVLTVSSEVKNEVNEEKEGYKRKEFSYTSFCRSFYLPENVKVEDIKASYKDGILNVEIPKDKEEKISKNREIAIS